MATFKNIRIKKKGGGSRLQRVKVLKSGKFKFVKNLAKKLGKSESSPRGKTNPKRKSVKRMAKKKRTGNRQMTIPLAPVLPLAVPLIQAGAELMANPENATQILNGLSIRFTGYDAIGRSWNIRNADALIGMGIGLLVHKFVGGAPLNFNRMLASAKVPFIRI